MNIRLAGLQSVSLQECPVLHMSVAGVFGQKVEDANLACHVTVVYFHGKSDEATWSKRPTGRCGSRPTFEINTFQSRKLSLICL